jgi:cystathionine beta-lyase/cystathionine gamma-synthase
MGGVIVARHGITSKFLTDEQKADYATWVKLMPSRNSGACMSAQVAHQFLHEIKYLRSNVKQYCETTMELAKFLNEHPKIKRVHYPGLPNDPMHELAKRQMCLVDSDIHMYGHLLSIVVKGGVDVAHRVANFLEYVFLGTDLGRVKTVVTPPSVSTHQQQGEESRKMAGIPEASLRVSVGMESARNLIANFAQALSRA